jgi:hypothetical protein
MSLLLIQVKDDVIISLYMMYVLTIVFYYTGEELVKEFIKHGSKCQRSFCSACGSRILNRLEHRPDWLGFFPALLDEEVQHNLPPPLQAQRHYLSEEAVINLETITDGLPRV